MISLKALHTFSLSHSAKTVNYLDDLADFLPLVSKNLHTDFILLGQGSNCVFVDDVDLPVYVNRLRGIELTRDDDYTYLDVMAGENWHELVVWCLNNGIFGLENLALIPGTVGAAPIQNIGAYGKEAASFIDSVTYFDLVSGETRILQNKDCSFGYRDSIFKNDLKNTAIITSVQFRLSSAWTPVCEYGELKMLQNPTPTSIFDKVCEVRSLKLPDYRQLGNAGSFFKNPIVSTSQANDIIANYPKCPHYPHLKGIKLAAGWLIDQCGLKGKNNINVAVHKNQALVLVNASGTATGDDLIEMVKLVIDSVELKFGIRLEPEVRAYDSDGETQLVKDK